MFVELETAPRPVVQAVLAPPARPARQRLRSRLAKEAPPYLFLLPALLGLLIWIYLPLAKTLQLSFYDWNLLPDSPAVPVGGSNYRQVLDEPELPKATVNTLIYIVGLLPFTVVLPVVVALMARGVRGRRMQGMYRAAIFAPFLVAPVAAAVLWQWLLTENGGLVNRSIGAVGIDPVNWLREPTPALVAIILIAGWKLLGFSVLVVSAGLSGINGQYAEAAAVDGAGRWQIARRVTLPLLSPTLMFMAVFTVLVSAQLVFPLIDALTQGGPGDATTNLYYLLYEKAFTSFDAGLASAAGVLFFCAFAGFAIFAVWVIDRWSFHDD